VQLSVSRGKSIKRVSRLQVDWEVSTDQENRTSRSRAQLVEQQTLYTLDPLVKQHRVFKFIDRRRSAGKRPESNSTRNSTRLITFGSIFVCARARKHCTAPLDRLLTGLDSFQAFKWRASNSIQGVIFLADLVESQSVVTSFIRAKESNPQCRVGYR